MKSNHPIEQEELMAYLDGELETERASMAATHLEHCKECQKLAADLRGVSQKLMEWELPRADSEAQSAITAALAEDKEEEKPRNLTFRIRKTWREILKTRRYWGYSVAGAALGVILISITAPRLRRDHSQTFYAPSAPAPVVSQQRSEPKPQPSNGPADSTGWVSSSYYTSQNNDLHYADQIRLSPALPQQRIDGLTSSQSNPPQSAKEQKHDFNLPVGPMVVRTAELALIAPDFEPARKNLEETVKRHHGYFGNMTVGGAADSGRLLDAVLRLPADQLDSALGELKKMGRVESESQKGDEVTQQYVDLQARLTNARNTEQRLTDLLRQRTGKLSDVLEVEEQIDAVRERIEQMDAEKKTLANQVSFATVTLKIREDYKARVQMVPPSTSSRIRNAAVEGYESMVNGLISIVMFLASWIPTLLLWSIILFFPVRGIWRKIRRARVEA